MYEICAARIGLSRGSNSSMMTLLEGSRAENGSAVGCREQFSGVCLRWNQSSHTDDSVPAENLKSFEIVFEPMSSTCSWSQSAIAGMFLRRLLAKDGVLSHFRGVREEYYGKTEWFKLKKIRVVYLRDVS
jgi:hypothetical protein